MQNNKETLRIPPGISKVDSILCIFSGQNLILKRRLTHEKMQIWIIYLLVFMKT